MTKEIYEALKKRISIASEEKVKAFYEEYPKTDREVTVYYFDLKGIDDDCPGIVHAMLTKNIWNVAQRFYMFLCDFDYDESKLLSDRHVSCK